MNPYKITTLISHSKVHATYKVEEMGQSSTDESVLVKELNVPTSSCVVSLQQTCGESIN